MPLALYLYTAAPGAGWIDSPMIAFLTRHLVMSVWVNYHNLFHLVGHYWTRLLPFDDVHYGHIPRHLSPTG